MFQPFAVFLHYLQAGLHRGSDRGWRRGGEDIRARRLQNPFHDVLTPRHKRAVAARGFAERRHVDDAVALEIEVFKRAFATIAQHAKAMGVIND